MHGNSIRSDVEFIIISTYRTLNTPLPNKYTPSLQRSVSISLTLNSLSRTSSGYRYVYCDNQSICSVPQCWALTCISQYLLLPIMQFAANLIITSQRVKSNLLEQSLHIKYHSPLLAKHILYPFRISLQNDIGNHRNVSPFIIGSRTNITKWNKMI
jgi:hypothetical protein